MSKLRVLDLFSGIGGFSLGLERAGMQTVAFCEIEPFCRAVLKKHWPEVPCYDDIRTLTAKRLAEDGITAEVISGGFPCQPYSVAGKRMGHEDDRALWPEYCRLIQELKPSWVIGENVVGLSDLGLDDVLADLESCGYSARTFDIPSCVVGLQTMERHLWIVAASNSIGQSRNKQKKISDFNLLSWELRGSYQGITERWSLPGSRVCGAGKGLSAKMDRIKALGNAVPPQIPEIIGKAIIASLGE